MSHSRLFKILLDHTPVEGGTPTVAVPVVTEGTPDLAKVATNLVASHGDSTSALKVLLGENHEYRTKLREAKSKLPPEGSVILTPDEGKVLAAYRAMGTPEELRTGLETGKAAVIKASSFELEKLHGTAATLVKFKPAVLARLATQDKLDIVLTDGKDKLGKAVQIPVVQIDKDKTVPLAEYAETHWKEFLPSLKADLSPALAGATPLQGRDTLPRPAIRPEAQKPRINSF